MSLTKERAVRCERRKILIGSLRPMLWEKIALGLTIPKGWETLFDLKKEKADMNAMIKKGLL
jgi:hypothetical protein